MIHMILPPDDLAQLTVQGPIDDGRQSGGAPELLLCLLQHRQRDKASIVLQGEHFLITVPHISTAA